MRNSLSLYLGISLKSLAFTTPNSKSKMSHARGLASSSRDLSIVTRTPFAHKPLQLFLQEMLRFVARLKVNVHICPLDIRQTFQLHLQLLSHVVRTAQGLRGIHDNIDFHYDARTRVVGANGVNGNNGGRMRHGDVGDPLLHLRVCCHTDKELKL